MTSEILHVADQVAREKGIDREIVIAAMESAIQTASRKKYGAHKNISAKFDPVTGQFLLHQLREVVAQEEFEDPDLQLPLAEANKLNPSAQVGDFLAEELPPIEYGRIAAQTAKQVIVQKVREAERERVYAEYVDRVGELVNGVVKRVERSNIHVDLGRASAFLPYEEQLSREHYRQGDRIRAFIKEVRDAQRGPQVILSRTHPHLVARLFEVEVPEIYDGIVEVKAVARDAGFRTKMAVRSNDSHVDPVGACVGMRGSRVQGVVTELQGERIDIIEWSSDPAVFVCNALAPAEVTKVVLDEEDRNIKVVVSEEQLSLAIGRRGQNVRLASELTGYHIDIVTEQEDNVRRAEEFEDLTRNFMALLGLEEAMAALLVQEGFSTLEEVAYVPREELLGIEGVDEEVAEELRTKARNILLQQALENERRKADLEVDPRLSQLGALPDAAVLSLAEKGVRTLDELADLDTEELMELANGALSKVEAERAILEARQQAGWFDGEHADSGSEVSA